MAKFLAVVATGFITLSLGYGLTEMFIAQGIVFFADEFIWLWLRRRNGKTG